MADKYPTPGAVHEQLIEALTAYLSITMKKEGSILATDYVVTVAGIDLAEADGRVYYATAYTGPPHTRLGLAEILTTDVNDGIFSEPD